MGARTTPAYQTLVLGAACVGLAYHEAVRKSTALFVDQERPAAEIETDSSLREITGALVGDETGRP